MDLITIENTFPRGGNAEVVRDPSTEKRRHVKAPNLFGGTEVHPKQTKKRRKIRKAQRRHPKRLYEFPSIGRLTPQTVSEGMLVLGSVCRIERFQLIVTLPGNIQAIVLITNTSESYSAAMGNNENSLPYQLKDMFKVGQHVIARVISKVMENGHAKITLSMMPQCIYSDLSHTDVVKGSVLMAAVKGVEKKGYVMDIGVKNTTAFLKHSNAEAFQMSRNDGRPLGIGQLVRCLVMEVTAAETCTIAVLSASPELVTAVTCNTTGATLNTLVPGMQFDVTVATLFRDGIQVRLSNNFVGYVHQDHFSKPFKTPDNFEIGKIVSAKVLYILDNGAVYFTLKSGIFELQPRHLPLEVVKIGDVIQRPRVISINNEGYTVRVGSTVNGSLKGFIPLSKTMLKLNTKDADEECDVPVAQRLANKHPVGPVFSCRIMDYNYIDEYYLCTMNNKLINEKYTHASMLELGLVLHCFVKNIQPSGIYLSLGKSSKLNGFVRSIHLSDDPLAYPEKFKVGQPCAAKVLSLKNGNVLFTLKPTLVQSKAPMLTSFDEAELDVRYDGTVVSATYNGLLVEFYNNTTGWVPRRSLNMSLAKDKGLAKNITKNFYVGQVVRCTLVRKIADTQRLILDLKVGPLQQGAKTRKNLEETLEKLRIENREWARRKKEEAPKKQEETKEKLEKEKKVTTVKEEPEEIVPSVFDMINTVDASRREHWKRLQTAHMEAATMSESGVGMNNVPVSDKADHLKLNGCEQSNSLSKTVRKRKSDQLNGPTDVNGSVSSVNSPEKKKKMLDRKPAVGEAVELPPLSVSSEFKWDATANHLPAFARATIKSESSDEVPEQSSMAYHLQATEIENARSVARRTLKAIAFRQQQERLNVWVALLKRVNLYGTKETLELTLEEAVRVNDAYEVHTQMLHIYKDSHKLQEGDQLIGVMTNKYKHHKDTWINAATFYMQSAQMEKARALLRHALASMEEKEHVALISRFAQLENNLGSMERAQMLMDHIRTTYPK